MKSGKIRLLIASMLALLLYGAEAYAKSTPGLSSLPAAGQIVTDK